MTNPNVENSVALIAGPTASGKTALALRLAEQCDVTIINADSAQVYRELPILSAQPSPAEMQTAPHRLFGYREGCQPCSAASWAQDAKHEIALSQAAGRLPVLVGGTGLYLRTLLDGIAPIPDITPEIRAQVRTLDAADAYDQLSREDPDMANRLHPSDRSRLQRALEVIRSTGRSIAEWRQDRVGGIGHEIQLYPIVLLPPREWIYERCDTRFCAMIEQGAPAEVERLLASDPPVDAPILRAIGVPEIAAWLSGQCSRHAMIEQGQLVTRRYAKRQYTWFRNQTPADWTRYLEPLNSDLINEIVIKLQQ